ncbi:MAG TPA: alkaline phosphatase family protein [Gemmatimonadales bacterium]|nr:alkaline phosphatase family protein [Gemmatimonadales bacterium]
MLGALLLLLQATPALPRPVAPAPREHPQLAVLIVVDQMRPDYFTRFGPQLTGGLRRILDQGTLYLDGRQDHGMTETAPGHSTLLSGRVPAHTGILANNLGVNDPAYSAVGGPGYGASPLRFQGTTLYDWMVAHDSATRVFSVSRKDRGAILPIGRARRDVYWWINSRFGTSRYYRDSLPSWLKAYNTRPGWRRFLGASWTPLLPDSAYPEPDSEPWEHRGKDFTFPHQMPADSATLAVQIVAYPYMDSLTLDLALEGTAQLQLGHRDAGPDLLVVSLSTTDAIGHGYGPDSKEMHDQILRLDHWLGWFQDSLAKLVPGDRILWALSADHGVQSWSEYTVEHGGHGARLDLDSRVDTLRKAMLDRWGTTFNLAHEDGLIYGDIPAMKARGIDVAKLADSLAAVVRGMEGVRAVFTPRALARARAADPLARVWRRAIPASQGWLVASSPVDGYVWDHTDHGSTALLDQRVPIAFWGIGIPAGTTTRTISTTDIAPTLAALLHVKPTEPVDGTVLPEIAPRLPGHLPRGLRP